MRSLAYFLLTGFFLGSSLSANSSSQAERAPLSKQEAEAVVASRMEAEAAIEASQRSALKSQPALAEWEVTKNDGAKIVFRRVPSLLPVASKPQITPRKRTKTGVSEFSRLINEAKPSLNISLSATVYDGEVSEIRLWHDGEHFKVLSNVAFNHLQGISDFEDETARWSLFATVEEVDMAEELQLAEEAKRLGEVHKPPVRPDKGIFSSLVDPEYVIYADEDQPVPEAVLTQLDAVHAYYLTNEKELAIDRQRREALAEAHRQYQEENPEEPEDIIINFWRESEKTP